MTTLGAAMLNATALGTLTPGVTAPASLGAVTASGVSVHVSVVVVGSDAVGVAAVAPACAAASGTSTRPGRSVLLATSAWLCPQRAGGAGGTGVAGGAPAPGR